MTDPVLLDTLARGALVVTPNNRLARELVAAHDRSQRAAGRTAWPSARAMPWNAFVADLWQRALDAALALPRQRLDEAQALHLWRELVRDDLADRPLVDVDATASLAAEAWSLVQAYGAGGESWRGFDSGEDPAAFARWAGAFVRTSASLDALDLARAGDAIAHIASGWPDVAALDVVLAGFLELSPQQQRLVEALRSAGAQVALAGAAESEAPSDARVVAARSLRDELLLALGWAREHATADPAARIAIVVPDLATRREEVRLLAEDLLCPALQWPDAVEAPRPFDLSAPLALAQVPLVTTALQLLALAHGSLSGAEAATLLRSPYLPGGREQWVRRSAFERDWLEDGASEFTHGALLAWLERREPSLAATWRSARPSTRLPPRASPRAWAEVWRALLEAHGWCAGRALSSAEFQARRAFGDALAQFVRLGAIAPELDRSQSLAALQRTLRNQAFQPESPGTQVQILGLLEAVGLRFDALWVAGMTAQAWPQAASPNPFLPVAWQRERGVPRSHPARELAHAERVTASLARAAPEVVFSYAKRVDDHACAPSPLLAGLPVAEPLAPPPTTAEAAFAARLPLARVADARAPALASGSPQRGGAYVLGAQSDCPFQALAKHRLAAREWPTASTGLTPQERGTLVHATLEAFWTDVRDRAGLVALDDAALDACVGRAFDAARAKLAPARWASLPQVVAAGEGDRVVRLVRAWLDGVERARPPFVVEATECRRPLSLAGLAFEVAFDRLDRLDDGTLAIVDYKSGRGVAPAKWFGERPQGTQLPAYAVAQGQGEAQAPVSTVVFAQLRPGEIRALGLAADALRWPGLAEPADLKLDEVPDWPAALAHWTRALEHLAQELRDGEAAVDPREDAVCSRCHLHPVCRIAGVDPEAEESNGNGGAT